MANTDETQAGTPSFEGLSGPELDETLASARPERMVGKYPVMHKLGQGAMGEVWLGRHPDLDIPVAIKTLPKHLANRDDAYVERFMREAKAAARINHTHVVRVYDCGVDEDVHFIVMEYVDGGDVRKMQSRLNGPMPIAKALDIVASVAEALKEAAVFKIIHRDIKPENIMVDNRGTVKLADLGLAKIKEDVEDTGMTQSGATVGSPKYIAPEQVKSSKDADHRSDIYSLGATFYHLVTGKAPFHAESSFEMMLKHVEEPLVHPREVNPDLADDVCQVILKMTEKNPDDRYQTAEELSADLQRLMVTHGKTETTPSATVSKQGSGTSGKALIIAAAMIAVAIIAYKFIPARACDPGDEPKEGVVKNGKKKGPPELKITEGKPFTLPKLKLSMVPIAEGTFQMGWDKGRAWEGPTHKVTITRPFWMGKTEVTTAQFAAFADDAKFRTDAERAGQTMVAIEKNNYVTLQMKRDVSWKTVNTEPQRPVVCVSWNDAFAFCKWLTEKNADRLREGYEFRLPTEAEWAYSCQAGTNTSLYWGDDYKDRDAYEWYNDQSLRPNVVGEFKPNPWGLHDMLGDTFELCLDQAKYWRIGVETDTFKKEDMTDPLCLTGDRRMLRGMCWLSASRQINCHSRSSVDRRFSSGSIGFRIVLGPILTDKLPE